MLSKIFLLIFIFTSSILYSQSFDPKYLSNQNKIEVVIQTDKSSYLLGEQVNFKIELINKTSEKVSLLNMSDFKSISYISVYNEGERLKFRGEITDYYKEPVLTLEPYKQRVIYLNLNDYFGIFVPSKLPPVEQFVVNRYFKPGNYKIGFSYKDSLYGSTTFDVDSLSSEQSKKYLELLDIYSIPYHTKIDFEKKVNKIKEFIEKYPGIDYLDQNEYFNIFFYSHVKQDFSQEERDEILSVIDNFPNSFNSIYYVYFLSQIISHNPTDENNKLFDDLLKKYPDTILSYEINKLIESKRR